MRKRNNEMEILSKSIQTTNDHMKMVVDQMAKERTRMNAGMSATFETLSRRERPIFVKELRNQGYSQEEVGEMVNRSQSSVAQYEKKYNLQNSK